MLSDENKSKIILTGLYKCQPDIKYRGKLYSRDLYWCFNWTFKPHFGRDSNLYMTDTYFNDQSILVSDANIDEFELIFDFNNVVQTNKPEEYNNSDVFHVAIDSGGMYCGGKYFVKKNAQKSKDRLIKNCQGEIDSLEWKLEHARKEMEQLLNGTHYKLKQF